MPITILLADDHGVVRDGLQLLLSAQPDLRVVGVADDGRQAVLLAAELRPHVALLDISMPELNGVEATRQIVAAQIGVRVIILSMHAAAEHIGQALRAGARGYLLKESAGSEVVAAVRAVHDGERYFSRKISDTVPEEYLRGGPAADPLASLSPREREILQLVVEGKSSAEAARILSLSPKTVETYRSRLMQKLGLSDLPSLVRFAIQRGLTPLE